MIQVSYYTYSDDYILLYVYNYIYTFIWLYVDLKITTNWSPYINFLCTSPKHPIASLLHLTLKTNKSYFMSIVHLQFRKWASKHREMRGLQDKSILHNYKHNES